MYKFLFEHCFLLFLSTSLRVELLDHWVLHCSNSREHHCLSEWLCHFTYPQPRRKVPFLHILVSTCFPSFLSLVIPVGVKQCLTDPLGFCTRYFLCARSKEGTVVSKADLAPALLWPVNPGIHYSLQVLV